jgi:hypothetical protein
MYMKSQTVKMLLLAASILASPVLTFAGGQPNRVYTPGKNESQDRAGVGRNLNQGKGAGLTRNDVVLRGNAYRSETAQDSQALKQSSSAAPNWNDLGFHK